VRITFEAEEAAKLRTSARAAALDDPQLAYVLQQIADEGIDLDACTPWETIRERHGMPPLDDDQADVA
jgi:hypothetical protein